MKKVLAALFVFSLIPLAAPPAAAQERSPIDLVLVLDTSTGMSASFGESTAWLTGTFLRENLRLRDTFHLISFSDGARLEIARRIEGQGDLETIIARMLLMYPLDPSADTRAALSFAESYLASLPPGRPKKLILLSAGGSLGEAGTRALAAETAARAGSRAELEFVPVSRLPAQAAQTPPASRPAQPASPAAPPPAQAPAQSVPAAQTPPASGTAQAASPATPPPAQAPSAPEAQTPPAAGTAQAASPAAPPAPPAPPAQTATGRTDPPPPAAAPASSRAAQTPPKAARIPPSPAKGEGGLAPRSSLLFLVLLGIMLTALLVFLILLLTRRIRRSPNRVLAASTAARREERPAAPEAAPRGAERTPPAQPPPRRPPLPQSRSAKNTARYNGPLMLSLVVEDQNTAIGRRNTHLLKDGYSLSVGGGKSDYLIFLVPIPPAIADIRYAQGTCTFIPRRSQYFPDLGSSELRDCVGETIRIISDKNYEIRIRFELYEDPLQALNRLLTSVESSG